MKIIKDIPSNKICIGLDKIKAIEQKHQTRIKKQLIKDVEQVVCQLDKLNIVVIFKAKENDLDGL